jgi:hypothetical protein
MDKSDPDPRQSPYSGLVEAQNAAMKGRGRSQWRREGKTITVSLGGYILYIEPWSQIRINLMRGSGSASK